MAIKVTINPPAAGPSVRIKQNKQTASVLNFIPSPTIDTLSQINQIDVTTATEGASLVYNADRDKYEVKILPTVKGGLF